LTSKRQDKRKMTRQQQTRAPFSTDSDRMLETTSRRSPMLDAPPSLNRWTRNRIFGVGAAICAVLALARPSIVAIALIAGFAYAAAAFLRPT